jgi:aromatic-L-amino-acid/L-tryptophan decarboxylase
MERPGELRELAWPAERARAFGEQVLDLWADYVEAVPLLPAGRDQSPAEVRAAVTRPVPDDPLPPPELVAHLRELMLERSIQPGHGGFMAYISGAGTVPGGPAAMLAAALNQNLGGWILSPAATEVETHLLSWFAERFGLPGEASGAFVAGGATANFMALAAARDALAGWDVRRAGMAAGAPLAVYASEDVHDTIDRAADLLGLGSDAVRRIGTDERLRVRADAVAEVIAADVRAGVRPLLVVGTAGTTEFGAIDPLAALADVAAAHGCWFHVDAAYGGPAAMVDGLRSAFAGIERADSITCDPHKWMNTPISSSLVLFRDPARQHAAFTLETDYTRFDREVVQDMLLRYQWTPQFSRPFDALAVWVSLLAHGWGAFARRIAHDVELAAWLHHLVVEHDELEPTVEPQLSIVGFRYVPGDLRDRAEAGEYLDRLNDQIVYALQRGGRVFPSNAAFGGRSVIRACLIGFRTEADDVEALVSESVQLGRKLDQERRPGCLRRGD